MHQPATMVAHSAPVNKTPVAVEVLRSECVRKLMDDQYCKKGEVIKNECVGPRQLKNLIITDHHPSRFLANLSV